MIITEPSNKKKDSSVWAKGRKLGFTQNSFLRGDSTIEYREAIEQAVGKDKKNKVLPYPKKSKTEVEGKNK